jgi:hypothetical protein
MQVQSALSTLFAGANSVGVAGIFQFVFSDQERYWIRTSISNLAQLGVHPEADVTIELKESVFLAIVQGLVNIEELFAQGQLKITGNIGLATLLPSLVSDSLHPAAAKMEVEMNRRYPALPRFSEQLSASVNLNGSIDRRPKNQVSMNEFNVRYRARGIPLVFTQALNDWPLFSMPRDTALEQFANLQGITRHGDYAHKAFSSERDFRTTAMLDFIAAMDEAPCHVVAGPPAYMGNNLVPKQLLPLIRFPDYFKRSLYIQPRLWLGPKGTLTPLHRDDSDNLFAQVWGEKSMLLAAPHHRIALGSWSTSPHGGLEGCDFDPSNPNFEEYPAAKHVSFFAVHLKPGDLLFLPEGWFHQVRSLTSSLSINFWINSVREKFAAD